MNVTILSKTEEEIEIEISGEDHTLLNVLKDALLSLETVEAATYDMNPEQSGSKTEPILFVRTSEGDPLEAIEEATAGITDNADEFRESFTEAIEA